MLDADVKLVQCELVGLCPKLFQSETELAFELFSESRAASLDFSLGFLVSVPGKRAGWPSYVRLHKNCPQAPE